MVIAGETVNAVPLPSVVPPHETEYQFQSAVEPKLPPVTLMDADEPLHIVTAVVFNEVAGTELLLTVISRLTQLVVLQTFSALT